MDGRRQIFRQRGAAATKSPPKTKDLLSDPTILYRAVRATARIDSADEERSRGLLYLAHTSRRLPEPASLAIRGGGVRRRQALRGLRIDVLKTISTENMVRSGRAYENSRRVERRMT